MSLLRDLVGLDVIYVVLTSEPSLATSKMSIRKEPLSIVLRTAAQEKDAKASVVWIISGTTSEGCMIYQSRKCADGKRKRRSKRRSKRRHDIRYRRWYVSMKYIVGGGVVGGLIDCKESSTT